MPTVSIWCAQYVAVKTSWSKAEAPSCSPVADLHTVGHLLPVDVLIFHPRAFNADEALHAGVHGLVEDVHNGVEALCSEANQARPFGPTQIRPKEEYI